MIQHSSGMGGPRSTGLWQRIPESSALRAWAREIGRATTQAFDCEEWSHVGHAVMIEHLDEEAVRALLPEMVLEARIDLKIVERDAVVPGFEAWLKALPEDKPTLIYIEPGRWSGGSSDEEDSPVSPEPDHQADAALRFRKAFATLLRTVVQNRPWIFLTVAESASQMDRSLRQQHCFDRQIKWPEIGNDTIGTVFIEETGAALFGPAVRSRPDQLGAVIRYERADRRRRLLLQQALRRRFRRVQRPLEMSDILDLVVWGTAEEDSRKLLATERRVHAIHEAGHALACWLGSRDRLAPEYCSVSTRTGALGIMVAPYDGHERTTDDRSYADVVHSIRVLLAGRAAEFLLLGHERVSAVGSSSDLRKATALGFRMFGRWGLSPSPTSPASFAANLAVIVGEPSPSESARAEELVRGFLQQTFISVLALLETNRGLLERIVDALTDRGVLLQADFEALASEVPRPAPRLAAVS